MHAPPATPVLFLALLVPVVPSEGAALLEPLGLETHELTSVSVYGSTLAAGTNGDGVFWQFTGALPESGWNLVELDGIDVRTVYAHKSGPLGWAIAAGVNPHGGDDVFAYCSYMGAPFEPNTEGISADLTFALTSMSGYPDPTICGETYAAGGRALYRRLFGSGIWEPVLETTFEGHVEVVCTRESVPGVVVAGGAEGIAGFLLVKSTDFGETWDDISPPAFVADVDFTGTVDAETLFVAAGWDVFRSLDGGDDWESLLPPNWPPGESITEVTIDAERQRVFIAGGAPAGASALYVSYDWGESWVSLEAGLSGWIVDLTLDPSGVLFIAHESAGVFRLSPENVDVEDPAPVAPGDRLHVWPLPTRIGRTLNVAFFPNAEPTGAASGATFDVYDTAGQLVTPLEGAIEAGDGVVRATWNLTDRRGRHVAPGIYFVRARAEGFGLGAERKVVITR